MNYYAARQRQNDKRWDYTCDNRRSSTVPVGYCAGWREVTDEEEARIPGLRKENEKLRALQHKFHTDGHATEQEACDCYREYLLDNRLSLRPQGQTQPDALYLCKIEECGAYTGGYAEVDFRRWWLCDAHCTRACVEQLMPDVGEAMSSY